MVLSTTLHDGGGLYTVRERERGWEGGREGGREEEGREGGRVQVKKRGDRNLVLIHNVSCQYQLYGCWWQAGRQAGRFAVPFLRKSTHATAMRKCIPSAYHLFVRLCLRGRKGGWLL